MRDSIIIVGAGIGGLSTGCYAQMNGYRTRIFEMHDKPGGVCTSWQRKGFVFDGCIHNLVGTRPDSKVHRVWEELGAAKDWEVVDFEEFVKIEDPDGKAFTVYSDPSRLERHMNELAPEDAATIREFMKGLRRFAAMDMLSLPAAGAGGALKMALNSRMLMKWMRMDLRAFAARFKDPFLRKAFPLFQYDMPEVPVGIAMAFLGGLGRGDLGYPKGGSLAFARSIAERYCRLGGEIHLGSRVEKILVENNRAVGVRLADGTQHMADRIVSNADGRSTIMGMLEGRYTNPLIREYYEKPLIDHQQFAVHVSFGVSRDLSREPHALVLFLPRPVELAGAARDRLDLELFGFDTSFAPPGKSVLKVVLDSSYRYWEEKAREPDRYEAEKKSLAAEILIQLEGRFPGLSRQIEAIYVATPLTSERFTGNWQGLQAWPPAGKFLSVMRKGFTKTLPGLAGFSMVGQWAGGTIGVSTMAIMGRNLVKSMCKQDRKGFSARID